MTSSKRRLIGSSGDNGSRSAVTSRISAPGSPSMSSETGFGNLTQPFSPVTRGSNVMDRSIDSSATSPRDDALALVSDVLVGDALVAGELVQPWLGRHSPAARTSAAVHDRVWRAN